MNIGKVICDIRTKKGFRQGEFAKMVGLSSTYMSQIEANKKMPSMEVIEKIAFALSMPSYYLLFMGLEIERDIPRDKRLMYRQLRPAVAGLIEGIFL